MSFPYPRLEGQISYRLADGGARGREWFSIHRHPGGRTVRAMCEMDAEALIRDTSWSLDPQWRPVEGHVRVTLKGVLAGSTWYAIDGNVCRCRALTATHGHVDQVLTSASPFLFLGLHPLIGDGLLAAACGLEQPGIERTINAVTCSYSPNGERELLALPIAIGVTYVGGERLTVPAGEFEAHKFAVRWRPEWPPADYWVFGEDFVFLKSTWSVSQLTCSLESFRTIVANA